VPTADEGMQMMPVKLHVECQDHLIAQVSWLVATDRPIKLHCRFYPMLREVACLVLSMTYDRDTEMLAECAVALVPQTKLSTAPERRVW